MQLEKKKQFLVNTLFVLTLVFLFLFVFQYLSGVLFPILAGFIIAYSLRPLVVNITKRWNSNYQITAFMVVTAFYALIGILLWLGLGYLFGQVVSFFSALPEIYQTSIAPLTQRINEWLASFASFWGRLSPSFSLPQIDLGQAMQTLVGQMSSSFLKTVTDLLSSIPSIVFNGIFIVISSYFICMDFEGIVRFIKDQLSERAKKRVTSIKWHAFQKLWSLVRAYLLLMLITLAEVWIGLLALRVDYAFVLALLIAFADLLPILGTSSVLVPWAVFELLAGKVALGIGLLVLTAILWVLRNFTEPKIVGKQLGIHPVISLISMFAGIKLLGFIGIF